jgi:ferredoxin
MSETNRNVSRRKFVLASSAVAAAPLLAELKAASAETAAVTQTAAASAPLSVSKGTKIYFIGRGCVGCQTCKTFCPVQAIHFGNCANEIDQSKCVHCGTCYEECPNCVITETIN